jgi:hypothetical protein
VEGVSEFILGGVKTLDDLCPPVCKAPLVSLYCYQERLLADLANVDAVLHPFQARGQVG